ncbi:hypothetical protein ACWGHM_40835 [Streptomyces sp. NPDC054904]
MTRRTRLVVLSPLLACSVTLGPYAVATATAAPQAPAIPSCTVEPFPGAADHVNVKGSGFGGKVVVKETSGKKEVTVEATAEGTFKAAALPAGSYAAVPYGSQTQSYPCTQTGGKAETEGDDAKAEYDKGFQFAFQQIKANCQATQPKTTGEVDPNWQKGYDKGAELAANTFCKGQSVNPKAGKSAEWGKGYDFAFSRIQASCQATPPKTTGQVDPEWQAGYHKGAGDAAAKFCTQAP